LNFEFWILDFGFWILNSEFALGVAGEIPELRVLKQYVQQIAALRSQNKPAELVA
jgi:hypothetical protein